MPLLKEWPTKSGKKLKQKKLLRLICKSTVKNKIVFSSVAKTTWAKLQIFHKYRWNLPGNISSIQETIFTLRININMDIFMAILVIFIMEIITIIMAIELQYVKFRCYEKATKIWKNLPLFLTLLSEFQKRWEIFSNSVAFSQYLSVSTETGKNLICNIYLIIQFFNNQLHLPLYKEIDHQCFIWSRPPP